MITTIFLRINRRRAETENLNTQLKSISGIYAVAYLLDLNTDTFEEIISTDDIRGMLINGQNHAMDTLKLVMDMKISDISKRNIERFLDFSTLDERLSDSVTVAQEFLNDQNKWCRGRFITVDKNEDGTVHRVMWMVEVIDEEKRQRDNLQMLSETDRMTGILNRLDEEYFDIKRKNEAISIDDIMRDLQEVLQGEVLPKPDITMKYLFIDEFQDSDLSQIMVACLMIKLLNPALFVVGDVKQSIYRFRGATDQAFFVLKRDMDEMHIDRPDEFTLVNNYRTSASVLNRMDDYFKVWGRMGQLQYDKPVVPFNQEQGRIRMIHGEKKEQADIQIAKIASRELDALIERVESSGKEANEKTRVVMLTRSNNELSQLAGILRKNKIPAVIRRDGSFYASEAVRDFYIMVASFLFSDEPKYIFNFLLTPYSGEIDQMNLNDMVA